MVERQLLGVSVKKKTKRLYAGAVEGDDSTIDAIVETLYDEAISDALLNDVALELLMKGRATLHFGFEKGSLRIDMVKASH